MSRNPVLVGVSHVDQRSDDPTAAKEPIELMIDAVRAAAVDAGANELLNAGSVRVIRGLWPYGNPAKAVAEAIGCTNAETALAPYGGNFVQSTLNQSALDLINGVHDVIILTGAECGNTQAKAHKLGVELAWQALPGKPDRFMGPSVDMRHDAEKAIKLGRPIEVYPILETALRFEQGLSIEDHLVHISQLWASFSRVAAQNPNAWIREAKSAQEIRTVSAINRPVSFPYTKFLNSNNNVDQGAALIVCTEARAQKLGIPRDKWVYPWCGTDAHDHYHLSLREDLYSSPAIRVAGRRCLELARMSVADIDQVDVYSCFPSAVQVAARELGLDPQQPLTVTGGLTWAGGPLNNYVMHSIVRMAQILRERPGERGLITANGGYITKHAFGIYSTAPPEQPFQHEDVQNQVDEFPDRDVVIGHDGAAEVEAYSVMYGPDGLDKAFIACRLADGRRAWGVCTDPDVMLDMTTTEYCGKPVRLADHAATF